MDIKIPLPLFQFKTRPSSQKQNLLMKIKEQALQLLTRQQRDGLPTSKAPKKGRSLIRKTGVSTVYIKPLLSSLMDQLSKPAPLPKPKNSQHLPSLPKLYKAQYLSINPRKKMKS